MPTATSFNSFSDNGAIQAVASSFGVELSPIGMRNASEIEDAVDAFARAERRED